jgi:hypothetical protein
LHEESIIVPIDKNGDKTDYCNYRGISLLSTVYKMLTNILLSRLTPYAEEIVRDHQYGFRRNRSNTVHIMCIRQILGKKWEYNEAVRKEVLYNILIEFGIPTKLVRLIKMCLNETYSRVRVGKHLCD